MSAANTMTRELTRPRRDRGQLSAARKPKKEPEGSGKRTLVLQTAVVIGSVLIWHLFSLSPMAHKADMPGPTETFAELFALLPTSAFWSSIGATVLAWVIAFAACLVVGIPAGLVIGRNQRISDSTHFLIDFLRTIPPIALIPLSLLVLGPTITMVTVSAFLAGIWPILIQSVYAGRQLDPMLFQVSRSFRLKPLHRIRYVLAPDILAFIWPGIRLAVTAALLVTVAAQLIGGAPGIGSSIQNALLSEKPVTMFAYVIAAALFGLAINAGLVLIQAKLLWWHPSLRKVKR